MPLADPSTMPRLEHIAVWAEDIDRTTKFLFDTLGWRRHPIDFGVDDDSTVFGGMKLAFVDANGFWIELVQPTTEGPGMEFLKEKGNGSIVELDFAVDDLDKTVASLKDMGVEAIGMDGKPMQNGGLLSEWVMVDGRRERGDERLAYLPFDVSRGTSIELFWEYPSGVLLRRDAAWTQADRTPRNGPRLDHLTVLTADLDGMTKVYTDTLGLSRLELGQGLPRPWMGVGDDAHVWIESNGSIWIELVQPSGGVGKAVLDDKRFGEGAIMELVVEVDDLVAFASHMQSKGIVMTAGDNTALPTGQKAVKVESSGDRYAYFPLSASEGMRIMVVQRGPQAKSILSRRGDARHQWTADR